MTFHPDNNLPDCMLPDGGDCCAGHAAVVDDWHRLRAIAIERMDLFRQAATKVEALEAALDRAVTRGLEQVERIATLEAALREATTQDVNAAYNAAYDHGFRAGTAKVHPDHQPERDIDAERLDASGSYWPNGRRPPDAIG
jgi:hypothetical protein